jgi:hypothetical protein
VVNERKNFRIPTEFTLFGHRYTVTIEEDLFEKEQCYGVTDDDLKIVRLQKKKKVTKKNIDDSTKKVTDITFDLTDEVIIETFYHELVHVILSALGESKLSENEALVNMIGKAQLEIYLSSTYGEQRENSEVKKT